MVNLGLFLVQVYLMNANVPLAPSPRIVEVPSALKAITSHPELSGIVWCPPLKRYLVISDDVGKQEDSSKHAPFILGMDEQGRLDNAPIPVIGVDKINDPESICSGPQNTFFLITSHSLNRSEKLPKTRRQLLHLEVKQRTLNVIGKVDLTRIEGPQSILQIAGLPNQARLDIEAITYFKRSLLIGLKSPLTDAGMAVILQLADPEKVFAHEKIPEQALSRFLQIPLCIATKGKTVCQGISDMLVLGDGSLVLTANAPKLGPKDGGGSLWYVPVPIKQSKPKLLRQFPDKKPEGIAFSSDGKELIIVFDTDQNIPYWMRYPIPAIQPSR